MTTTSSPFYFDGFPTLVAPGDKLRDLQFTLQDYMSTLKAPRAEGSGVERQAQGP
jgi:hypothetical protein